MRAGRQVNFGIEKSNNSPYFVGSIKIETFLAFPFYKNVIT